MTGLGKRWLPGLLVLAVLPAAAAQPTWRMATTPHYRLISQLSDRASTQWMREFDLFIQSTTDALKLDMRALPPLTVVIFARDRDFEPYKSLKPNGRTANIAGYFLRQPTQSVIGMAHNLDNEDFRHTIHHEATHWLMSMDQSRKPAWFMEGIAEMFSTFERVGNKVNWGKALGRHLLLLREEGTLPLAQLLVEPSAIFDRDEHTARFYAESWAFTHFLWLSEDPQHRQLLGSFLEAFRTKAGQAAVDAVFGETLKEVEHDFTQYIRQSSYRYVILPAKEIAPPPPPQPAPPAVVEAALGFLALSADKYALAMEHALKAGRLDATQPDSHALMAWLEFRQSEYDKAAANADLALSLGMQDADLYLLVGDSHAYGRNAAKPDAAQIRINMYERAINLAPYRRDAYYRLVDALGHVDTPRAEDARFLEVGLTAYPGEDWLRVGIATVQRGLEGADAAIATLDQALRPGGTLDEQQRAHATRLRASWLYSAMESEIDALAEAHDYAKARTVVQRYQGRIGAGSGLDQALEQTGAALELQELLERYEAALEARRSTQAREIGRQLLAHPALTAEMRRYVEGRMPRK